MKKNQITFDSPETAALFVAELVRLGIVFTGWEKIGEGVRLDWEQVKEVIKKDVDTK